jgi:hypothetical protein
LQAAGVKSVQRGVQAAEEGSRKVRRSRDEDQKGGSEEEGGRRKEEEAHPSGSA